MHKIYPLMIYLICSLEVCLEEEVEVEGVYTPSLKKCQDKAEGVVPSKTEIPFISKVQDFQADLEDSKDSKEEEGIFFIRYLVLLIKNCFILRHQEEEEEEGE